MIIKKKSAQVAASLVMMMILLILLSLLSAQVIGISVNNNMLPIGTGQSQGDITAEEQVLFTHTALNPGLMTHFWTAGSESVDRVTWRYYIDGEKEASIVFQPSLACGTGFDDQTAPWGTKWFGMAKLEQIIY